ncbi:hypothetical protein LZ30DRAFT_755220 [Colletotrichum cereale]|nr:hypothetical protein LZ30DRAFT_755220 [Colletotrichum cereale]
MKLMCSHEHVKHLLKAWSRTRNRKLVSAKHFFYKIGTGHQKSLTGMYRTLLHGILESCPELARSALPNLWANARETPWQVGKEIHVSDRDVRKAFDYIVGSSAADNNFRFCFFIDGLDELENTAESSHGDLVSLFHNWHRRSSGNVKVVVSSREHNVFMDGFSPSQRICLHALTRRDLERFTQDKLSGIQSSEIRSQVVDKIVDKAQGIFFWVALVVDSVYTTTVEA